MICMDKTKTLGDMKRKIVEFLMQHHDVSISENNFQLYRINKLPINPGSFSWKNYKPEIWIQTSYVIQLGEENNIRFTWGDLKLLYT